MEYVAVIHQINMPGYSCYHVGLSLSAHCDIQCACGIALNTTKVVAALDFG